MRSLLFCLGFLVVGCFDSPQVTLKQGQIQGSVMNTIKDRKIFAFRGIPYAKPPMGSLRFKLPVPAEPWDDILDATQDSPLCPQISFVSGKAVGQEDCLVINVYTPQLPSAEENALYPVMVLFHGGGFMAGDASSANNGPRRLLDKDVVLVAMNYRLNVLGFLSTEDDSSPGNFGLWDQRLALQWVQDNVESFGGDKNRVTIFGGSAGAASVILHVLSQASSGLFHLAIAQSGSALCHWAVQERPLEGARDLARDVGCPTEPTDQLVTCLREKDPIELAKTAKTYMSADGMLPLTFAPVVDKTNGSKFLEDYPDNLLKAGKFNHVPVIIGNTKDEGLIALFNIERRYKPLDEVFLKEHLDQVLEISGAIDAKDLLEVKDRYFNHINFENPDEKELRKTLLKVISECFFKACTELTVKNLVEQGVPTFMYSLEYAHAQGFTKAVGYQQISGVSHGDDSLFFFDVKKAEEFEGTDKEISEYLVEMWTNFAKYGSPTSHGVNDIVGVDWEQVREGHMDYLRIRVPITMEYSSEKYQFWNERTMKSEAKRRSHDEL